MPRSSTISLSPELHLCVRSGLYPLGLPPGAMRLPSRGGNAKPHWALPACPSFVVVCVGIAITAAVVVLSRTAERDKAVNQVRR